MTDTSWVLPYLEKLFSRTDIGEIKAAMKINYLKNYINIFLLKMYMFCQI